VIASQAVITGVYSITQQAIQLGYAPRMELRHTSGSQMGQIYMPGVNWMMLLGVIALVLAFKSSTNLAAAYGIAVTGTMIITTLFAYLVARRQWGWRRRLALPVFGALLALDLVFLAANSTKILDGGWFPLVFGGAVYLVLTTWKAGRKLLHEKLDTQALAAGIHRRHRDSGHHHRARRGGIHDALSGSCAACAAAQPQAQQGATRAGGAGDGDDRIRASRTGGAAGGGGAAEPSLLSRRHPFRLHGCARRAGGAGVVRRAGIGILEPMTTSYFLGRETVMPRVGSEMPYWREALFATLYRNAGPRRISSACRRIRWWNWERGSRCSSSEVAAKPRRRPASADCWQMAVAKRDAIRGQISVQSARPI
jgi:KUP system potassium uptake protein